MCSLQQQLRDLIDDSKQKCFLRLTQKLNTIEKSTKAYLVLLKILLGNRKIPVIPPLFHHKTNLLLIFLKRLNFLIPFSQSNAP